jgi:leucyl aminopeptidase (aminopeptidase T)
MTHDVDVLSREELTSLVERVFTPRPGDTALAILVDLPDARTKDTDRWRARREMAAGWARELDAARGSTGLPTRLFLYRNVAVNNADLPATATEHPPDAPVPSQADQLDPAAAIPFSQVFKTHSILLAPTQLSATAPLKLAARAHGFRAATMPGFSAAMVPALRLDYTEINRRVSLLKELLDPAELAVIRFATADADHRLDLDLRHRTAHASGGLLPEPGTAGNLPSGETFIVPYEGERGPTRSAGTIPVQLGEEVVVYGVEANRAVRVVAGGPVARSEAARLAAEPAYGNLAELGLGVLADFGIDPIGEILLDEKLGLHIAFGRSDHFGGQVGARDFTSADAVVHIDRVYLPATQPLVRVTSVDLHDADGRTTRLMQDGRYVIGF